LAPGAYDELTGVSMRRLLTIFIIALNALLMGCTTPAVRSDVTVFQDWPAELHGSSFTFERSKEQANDLEYRTYENLVRNELLNLGFTEAPGSPSAKLEVALTYRMNVRDVHVVEPVVIDPYPYGAPFYGRGWRPYHDRFYSPYDPFWFGPPMMEYREDQYELFKRQLKITIVRTSDSRKIYDVTVDSEGLKGSLPTVMPYMVRSAFLGFPGKNGESRRIELPLKS
jgi:hypothetical protein